MGKFKTVNELVNSLKPDYPVYCIRPNEIKKSVNFFKENFPGKFFLKNLTDFLISFGRIQYTGLSGFNELTSSLTVLNFPISCVPRVKLHKDFLKNLIKKTLFILRLRFF